MYSCIRTWDTLISDMSFRDACRQVEGKIYIERERVRAANKINETREKCPLNRSTVVYSLDGLKRTRIHAHTHIVYTYYILSIESRARRRILERRKPFDGESCRSEDDCRRGFLRTKHTCTLRAKTTRVLCAENRNRPVAVRADVERARYDGTRSVREDDED